jgi:hypothetical protein
MKRNKMGSLFLVSILALAGVGRSYAGFTDEIYIYGTVDTATVTLDIVCYSCTFVWKIWAIPDVPFEVPEPDPLFWDIDEANEIAIYHGPCEDTGLLNLTFYDPGGYQICNYELVSWATAEAGDTTMQDVNGDDITSDIDVEFYNLFPCIDFIVDFVLHYTGSIPAKVNVAEILTYDPLLEDLWNAGAIEIRAYRLDINDPHPENWGELVDIGTQLHYCDYIIVLLIIHLPQDNIWQDRYGEFTARIEVIQWNDDCEVE